MLLSLQITDALAESALLIFPCNLRFKSCYHQVPMATPRIIINKCSY